MPLENAPDPETSNLYRQLSSEQLSTASKTNFDTAQDPVFLDSSSEDELRRINLVGQASNMQSQSGPIANTAQVVNTNITTSGTTTLFTPQPGTVWQIVAAGTSAGYTGLSWLILKIYDTTNSLSVEIASQTSYNTEFAMNEPIYVGYPCTLVITAGGSGTGGSTDISTALVRVR